MLKLARQLIASSVLLLTAVHLFAQAQQPTASSPGAPSSASAATFSLETDREPLVSLVGKWRFHPGDDPRWADPNFDDSSWPLLRSDQGWSGQGYKNLSGFAWYRFTLQDLPPDRPEVILLPRIATAYQLFADGNEIGSYAHMPPQHHDLQFGAYRIFSLPVSHAGGTLHLAMRVWHNPIIASYAPGGPDGMSKGVVGDADFLRRYFWLQQRSLVLSLSDQVALSVLETVLGITVLGLFFSRRSEREFLWFGLLLLADAVSQVTWPVCGIANVDVRFRDLVSAMAFACFLASALLFFAHILHARRSRVWRVAMALTLLSSIETLLYWRHWLSVPASNIVGILLTLPAQLWILALLAQRAWARDRNARLLLLPTVLLFGVGVMDALITVLAQFNIPFFRMAYLSNFLVLREPYSVSFSVVCELVFDLALLTFLIRRFAQARAREERYTADLEAARTLQQVLIPEILPRLPGLSIQTAYHPAQEVGGDFFQILSVPSTDPHSEADALIVLGDVAGKGLPAAMTVSLLVGALRSLAETTSSPAAILAGLNRRLLGRGSGFATALALRLSPSGLLTLSNAGHLSPYRNGEEIASPPVLPLGLDPEAEFPEQITHLAAGDRLTLLTDGVPEASDGHRELFGFVRTAALSTHPAHTIAETARAFGQTDDITVLSVTFTPDSV